MRTAMISPLVALLLAAGLAGHADAAGRPQKKRLQAHHYAGHLPKPHYPKSGAREVQSDYYEHVLEKVPFGSQRWWNIYEEQHGTPD
jgi:hypothetical protein